MVVNVVYVVSRSRKDARTKNERPYMLEPKEKRLRDVVMKRKEMCCDKAIHAAETPSPPSSIGCQYYAVKAVSF
jgi:hypothetical protein